MPNIDPLKKEDIKKLAENKGENLVSIFIPTFQSGNQTEQNSIRFENQMGGAREVLEKKGLKEGEIKEILSRSQDLLNSPEFWEHQSKGLAVFAGPGFFRYYRIPLEVKGNFLVGNNFYIEPLLPLIWENGKFYILSLSKQRVRLFQADRYNIDEIEADLPSSIEEALKTKDPENRVSFHTRTSGKGAMFYGQSPEEQEKKDLLRYFQIINDRLQKFFSSETSPLIVAAVDYFHPLFKKACRCRCLAEQGIVGNPDDMEQREIHKKAWRQIEPFFQKKEKEAKKEYQDLTGGPKASNDPKKIIPASAEGRVSRLFVDLDHQLWGLKNEEWEIREERKEGDLNLSNLASVQTFLNGGEVYPLRSDQMPEKAKMASVFRY